MSSRFPHCSNCVTNWADEHVIFKRLCLNLNLHAIYNLALTNERGDFGLTHIFSPLSTCHSVVVYAHLVDA